VVQVGKTLWRFPIGPATPPAPPEGGGGPEGFFGPRGIRSVRPLRRLARGLSESESEILSSCCFSGNLPVFVALRPLSDRRTLLCGVALSNKSRISPYLLAWFCIAVPVRCCAPRLSVLRLCRPVDLAGCSTPSTTFVHCANGSPSSCTTSLNYSARFSAILSQSILARVLPLFKAFCTRSFNTSFSI